VEIPQKESKSMNAESIAFIIGAAAAFTSWAIGWGVGYKIGHQTGFRRGRSVGVARERISQ